MIWNYRIFEHKKKLGDKTYKFYELHEVFYKKGVPWMCTQESMKPFGETPKELKKCLQMMLNDTYRSRKKILKMKYFEPGGKFFEFHNKKKSKKGKKNGKKVNKNK